MEPPDMFDGFYNNMFPRKARQRKFAWLPHRCNNSGKIIWLTYAYFNDYDVYEHSWITKEEYILERLKGEV
mgnify:FL=1